MRALEAASKTMELWNRHSLEPKAGIVFSGELSLEHCRQMLSTMMVTPFSYGKLCRWLGWMQAACVANGYATLEEMKQINKECAG